MIAAFSASLILTQPLSFSSVEDPDQKNNFIYWSVPLCVLQFPVDF
jgi:hypothetical protein